MTQTPQYAVFGHPVSHSRSPFIHQQFARQTGQKIEYCAIEAPLEGFAATTREFFNHHGFGANVTVPFKEQAFAICDRVSERAQQAGAVNTLIKTDQGEIHGDNTDGIGLVRDLLNHQVNLKDARILLLGAGGASRGVILPLLEQQPSELVISNRTLAKAERLVSEFNHADVSACALDKLQPPFDLLINATSGGLSGDVPAIPAHCLNPDTVCYDMVYLKGTTPFNQWAQAQGVTCTFDGLGMLVEQAAESFKLWRGVEPDSQAVLQMLRARL